MIFAKDDLSKLIDGITTNQVHCTTSETASRHARSKHSLDSPRNIEERFFRDLSQNRLKHGCFKAVPELIQAIDQYIENHNLDPKPFIWTAKASDILEKVKRARAKLTTLQSL